MVFFRCSCAIGNTLVAKIPTAGGRFVYIIWLDFVIQAHIVVHRHPIFHPLLLAPPPPEFPTLLVTHNQAPAPYIWTKSASDILEKVKRGREKLNKLQTV